jgi:hypothetical protein
LIAVPAPATQDQVTEYRDVVVKGDLLLALGAMRSRETDGHLMRKPHDADIEETSDDQAEEYRQRQFHYIINRRA